MANPVIGHHNIGQQGRPIWEPCVVKTLMVPLAFSHSGNKIVNAEIC